MKDSKVIYKLGILATVVGHLLASQAYAQTLRPSTKPIFRTTEARPNIQFVVDNSSSMEAEDVYAHNIMSSGGDTIRRIDAASRLYRAMIAGHHDKAYYGMSLTNLPRKDTGLIHILMKDYSSLNYGELREETRQTNNIFRVKPGAGSEVHYPLYEALKMFRGYPVTDLLKDHGGTRLKPTRVYSVTQMETPLRYRCQANHMILITDGTLFDRNKTLVWQHKIRHFL